MLRTREEWLVRLEEIKRNELLGPMEQALEIGINYVTYKKIMDPATPPVSMSVLRKVRDYIESKENDDEL